jgi:hypothetical protein
MQTKLWKPLLALVIIAVLAAGGCTTMKQWVGLEKPSEEDEDLIPPEAKEEQVIIDGKTYVRSKNPYWLNTPGAPEYMYVEKGREMVGLQQRIIDSIAKAIGKREAKASAVPPEKVQELVRQEVERILREQGLGGFVSRSQAGGKSPYAGRAVAVIPDLDTPRNLDGQNRTLAVALADALRKQKDISVASDDQVRAAISKAGITGKLNLSPNIKNLGDYLGVQGIVLTGIMPPEKGAAGVLVLEIYDAFMGTKTSPVVAPAENLNPQTITRFAQDNALRVAGELVSIEWFGRVEFVKEGKVYLSLGQNAGLKVGDRLKVVAPGKEVLNPRTHAVLGYTADIPQGELKVTELLGATGAVAQSMSGGPFKSGDKVRAR